MVEKEISCPALKENPFFNYVPNKYFNVHQRQSKYTKPGQRNRANRTGENLTLRIYWYVGVLKIQLFYILNLRYCSYWIMYTIIVKSYSCTVYNKQCIDKFGIGKVFYC